MAASNDRNKFTAGGSFGDTDPTFPASSDNDNAEDYAHDSAGLPKVGGSPTEALNKFPVGGRLGDVPPYFGDEKINDFAADSAGLPSVNQGEQTNMDMALEGNKFPRQTGHDSMTDDDLVHT